MTSDLPVVDPPSPDADSVREGRVAGVLLAAGASSRFGGRNKLLAQWDGRPLVRHAARTLSAADVEPLVAIVGHEADRVEAAVDGLGFECVHNPDHARGQATSLRAGVEALADARGDVAAAVFALGDMPFVAPETVVTLVESYRAGRGTALAAAHRGERGNPVLFDARYFEALADVTGDVGGRGVLLASDDATLVETGDPGVTRDVDTQSDLEGLRNDDRA